MALTFKKGLLVFILIILTFLLITSPFSVDYFLNNKYQKLREKNFSLEKEIMKNHKNENLWQNFKFYDIVEVSLLLFLILSFVIILFLINIKINNIGVEEINNEEAENKEAEVEEEE